MKTCKCCGLAQYRVGRDVYGGFVNQEGDHFDNAQDAYTRAAERNQENKGDWLVILIDDHGRCQMCAPPGRVYEVDPVIEAEQLTLF